MKLRNLKHECVFVDSRASRADCRMSQSVQEWTKGAFKWWTYTSEAQSTFREWACYGTWTEMLDFDGIL